LLFGHSFGTILAIAYYIKYPQHVSGMILTGSVPPFLSPAYNLTDFSKELSARENALRNRPEVARVLAANGFGDTTKSLDAYQKSMRFKITGLACFNIFHVERWRQFEGGRVYYNFNAANAIGNTLPDTYDVRPVLEKYPVPVTIIQGDHDYMDPAATHWAELAGQYLTVHVNIIKDASHYSWIDDPDAFRHFFQQALTFH
jgi:proline iminopeptidase